MRNKDHSNNPAWRNQAPGVGTASFFGYGRKTRLSLAACDARTIETCGSETASSGYLVSPLCWVVGVIFIFCAACVKPAVTAKEQSTIPVERVYSATPNQTYYALRWALASVGYPVGQEDLANGLLSTSWVPTSPTSHYLNPFDRPDPDARDFVNLSGYYKIEFQVVPDGDKTRVVATSRVRVVVAAVKSTGAQEQLVLNKVGDYLRTADPDVTNIGIK